MKVRFYRGPMNGKTYSIPDDRNHWFVDSHKSTSFIPGLYSDQPYEAVARHLYVRTRHTHPDGSVFFEWDKPKGTPIA